MRAMLLFVLIFRAFGGTVYTWSSHVGKACGDRNELGQFADETLASCTARCSSESTCVSFEYNAGEAKCQMSTTCNTDSDTYGDSTGMTLYVKNLSNDAQAAGDPHLVRFDGVKFDIDATGKYDLIVMPPDDGSLLRASTDVAPIYKGSTGRYNMNVSLTGSLLDGRIVKAIGGTGKNESRFQIDDEILLVWPLADTLGINGEVLTRDFTSSKLQFGWCSFSANVSKFCKQVSRVGRNTVAKSLHSIPYLTLETASLDFIIRWGSRYHSHVDFYTSLKTGSNTDEIGGLLGRTNTRRQRTTSPLLAASYGAAGADALVA